MKSLPQQYFKNGLMMTRCNLSAKVKD